MTTEVAQQKRSNDAFLSLDGSGMADHRSSNPTSSCGVSRKRLKTGGTISTKEKKDKIGQRVAALQQLVSPFGKTDTASVLLEATEYVRFLHDQLRVLSAPYLRTTMTEKVEERGYYCLRSRGLCLVPVSTTLRVARSNGADLWAPINPGNGKHTGGASTPSAAVQTGCILNDVIIHRYT